MNGRQYSIFQCPQQVLTESEAWQVVQTHEHHFNDLDNLVCILLYSHKAETHELSEQVESFALNSTEDFNHFLGKLEGSLLEFDTLSRGVREEESEVNMDYVSLNVYQDVAIVTILNLQDVAH